MFIFYALILDHLTLTLVVVLCVNRLQFDLLLTDHGPLENRPRLGAWTGFFSNFVD